MTTKPASRQIEPTKALRQRAQLVVAFVTALLLILTMAAGTFMAWRVDERATHSMQRVVESRLAEAAAERRAAFLKILHRDVDGRAHSEAGTLAPPPFAAAAASARQAGLHLYLLDREQPAPRALDGEMRPDADGASAVAGKVAARLHDQAQTGRQTDEMLLTIERDTAAYVFVATARGQAGPALAVWPLDARRLAELPALREVADLQVGSEIGNRVLRAGVLLSESGTGESIFISWRKPMQAMEHWLMLLPLLLLATGGVLTAIVLSIRFSIRSARLVEEIESRAFDRATRDPLTGLRNRSGFKMKLDLALDERSDGLTGVIYLDLDRFKEVNDGYGHETGDKLLIAVSARLKEICGSDASIARLGGDEFAIVVSNRRETAAIVTLGQTISQRLGQPFVLGSTEVVIGGSVGIAIAPEDGANATELVRRADISMYRAKTAGRGQAIRFDHSMEDEIRRRKLLEGELRHAIARDQLSVHYQPVMASDGESLIGVEALLRWQHPTEGSISPMLFIPLAEETGQIVEIGEWAMRRAMVDALRWPALSLAINVSPVQFRRKDLVENTLAMAREIGVEPRRIEIEITEGVLMDDADAAIEVISGFRDAGMHVALDDFGTGYASLSYLRRFPFDKLKVDQAFVRNLGVAAGSAAIIHSVIALGRSLGMTVHAEGVETLEHHIFLRAAGCHHFQGYYFSKPLPLAEMDAFAARSQVAMPRYGRS